MELYCFPAFIGFCECSPTGKLYVEIKHFAALTYVYFGNYSDSPHLAQ